MFNFIDSCLTGLAAFKLFGGRFWAIAPSSYTAPGSFARKSTPATEGYISSNSPNKMIMDGYFEKYGCHTCSKKHGEYHADHMPPRSIGKMMRKAPSYRYYPQCKSCSNKQGGILLSAVREISHESWPVGRKIKFLHNSGGGAMANNHGAKFRINHLAGGIYGPISVLRERNRGVDENLSSSFDWIESQLWMASRKISTILKRCQERP